MGEAEREEPGGRQESKGSVGVHQGDASKVSCCNSVFIQTQKRIAETLNGVKGTLKDIKDTNTKIDTFKK